MQNLETRRFWRDVHRMAHPSTEALEALILHPGCNADLSVPKSPGFGSPTKCQERAGDIERDGNIRAHRVRQPREDSKGKQEREGGSCQEQPGQHETGTTREGRVCSHAETSIPSIWESLSGGESPDSYGWTVNLS